MGPEAPLMAAEDIWKQYGGKWVLRGASLRVGKKELVFILGPNGAGKTTLLRIMAGLTRPTRGRVTIECGKPPRECVGYVGHSPLLYPEMTVEENLRFYASLHGWEDYRPGDNIAWETLGLERVRGKRVSQLSYGWRKRADLARALISSPSLLLLDEPFTGLDEEASQRLVDMLQELGREGIAVVMAAPRPDDEYTGLASRVLRLVEGRLIGVGGETS